MKAITNKERTLKTLKKATKCAVIATSLAFIGGVLTYIWVGTPDGRVYNYGTIDSSRTIVCHESDYYTYNDCYDYNTIPKEELMHKQFWQTTYDIMFKGIASMAIITTLIAIATGFVSLSKRVASEPNEI